MRALWRQPSSWRRAAAARARAPRKCASTRSVRDNRGGSGARVLLSDTTCEFSFSVVRRVLTRAAVTRLLLGFAHKRASSDNLPPAEAKTTARRWVSYWLDQLAVVHARYVARCIYNRASACKDAVNPSFRPVSTLDADDAHFSMPPPPPAQSPEMLRAAAAAAAAAVGLA
jgi:hypothetical protein